MDVKRWVETGVYGLEAGQRDDGVIVTRTAGGTRRIELDRLWQIAAMSGPDVAPNDPWTPDLARTVLRALGLPEAQGPQYT
ncbi:hypothetical protein AB0953_02680 [Streptomyces sp. NPDC046866]|uniref:hypothetical protein n=1 Tax=Streptomyces sp. NPDC046866 TaxID=3154921 RepID=UPI0034569F13